jgi:hypothetical protein
MKWWTVAGGREKAGPGTRIPGLRPISGEWGNGGELGAAGAYGGFAL